MATVTGQDANVWITNHAAATLPTFTSTERDTWYGMSDFSLTFDRGSIEHPLIASPGNYYDQGKLSMNGSFTMGRFGSSGNSYALKSIIDGTGTSKYLSVSGNVSDGTDNTYLKWFLVSCQVTGWDMTIGNADTITEASVDFIVLDPQNIEYTTGLISDSVTA